MLNIFPYNNFITTIILFISRIFYVLKKIFMYTILTITTVKHKNFQPICCIGSTVKNKTLKSIAIVVAAPVNPFAIMLSLQNEGKLNEASALSQEVNNFLFHCFEQNIAFSQIQKLALEKDWLMTEKALCQFADTMIKTIAQKNIEMGQDLINCFTILNDLSNYVFKLPYKIGTRVIEALQDIPEDLHMGNAANLPELPLLANDIVHSENFLLNVKEFCENHMLLITLLSGICLFAYLYCYHKQSIVENDLENPNIGSDMLPSSFEIFYLSDIKLFLAIFIIIIIILLKTKVQKRNYYNIYYYIENKK